MKKSALLFVVLVFAITACNQQASKEQSAETVEQPAQTGDGQYGKDFDLDEAVSSTELVAMLEYQNPVEANLRGKIVKSCKHTGCWMDIDLGGNETVHVTFADDAFTIPLDAAGKTAIFTGTGSREKVSVDLLKAYAKDEGKTPEEIDAITEPGWEYTFIAEGVALFDDQDL